MDYFAGLDVSVKETSVCIVDDTGKIVREARVASEPEALLQVLANTMKAQINKTDRNDARGIAQLMRAGLYRPVHVKTLRSQKLRMLLTHRKLLQSKAIAIENDLRATLRNFGLKVGIVGTVKSPGALLVISGPQL
jgi:transposase